MKKVFIPAAAIAVLALGGVAVGAKPEENKAKFDSEITLNYNQGPYDPYDPYYEEAVFTGTVTATPTNDRAEEIGTAKCEKKRQVIIRNLDDANSSAYAVVRTDADGNYSADATQAAQEPGTYRARVTKKVKVHANVKCKGDKSNEVEVPTPDTPTK